MLGLVRKSGSARAKRETMLCEELLIPLYDYAIVHVALWL
ncbi:MAG: hypothetical protein K0Q66_2227 [Chitinophagaceae bacterium]|jgi:hypothetical protein|nr:hypothetical protein [Chitinophagaceae bacterium]